MLCFHAELDTGEGETGPADPTLYSTFLASRPQALEVAAIALITRLHASYPSLRLHIVHLSASAALPLVRAAKAAGLPLTVETCFHYLALAAQHIPHGRPEFKCCPPIREEGNREALWAALVDGTIDCVVSDHSPCVAALKKVDEGDIMGAWGGISTLGLGLSLLWTEARKRGVGIERVVDWLCVRTAKHAGLEDRKGRLEVGLDADIVVWDPDAEIKVSAPRGLPHGFRAVDAWRACRSRRSRSTSRTSSRRTRASRSAERSNRRMCAPSSCTMARAPGSTG